MEATLHTHGMRDRDGHGVHPRASPGVTYRSSRGPDKQDELGVVVGAKINRWWPLLGHSSWAPAPPIEPAPLGGSHLQLPNTGAGGIWAGRGCERRVHGTLDAQGWAAHKRRGERTWTRYRLRLVSARKGRGSQDMARDGSRTSAGHPEACRARDNCSRTAVAALQAPSWLMKAPLVENFG